jgi:hypothetical protein
MLATMVVIQPDLGIAASPGGRDVQWNSPLWGLVLTGA